MKTNADWNAARNQAQWDGFSCPLAFRLRSTPTCPLVETLELHVPRDGAFDLEELFFSRSIFWYISTMLFGLEKYLAPPSNRVLSPDER